MNETILWLVMFAITLCFGSLVLLFIDLAVVRKTDKKLEKFNKWYEEYEKDRENEKMKIIKDFEKWYKENKDE